jgi:hypothetical protein
MMTWTNDLRIRADVAPSVASQQGAVAYRVNRTVSQSQIVPIAGFQRPKWAAMATNPNAPGMMATGYKIALHSATHYKVTVTYSYPSGDTNEDEDGNPINPDNPDNPDDAKEKYKVKISDRSNMTLEPILSYYKLRDTNGNNKYSEDDMRTLAVYLSGGLVLCSNGQYRLKCEKDETPGHIQLPVTPITPYITLGYKKISQNNTVITKTYTARRVDASKVARVGKIVQGSEFGGATEVQGYKLNYLFTRYSVHKVGNREYEITEEYTQSNPGGWSTDLYKNG